MKSYCILYLSNFLTEQNNRAYEHLPPIRRIAAVAKYDDYLKKVFGRRAMGDGTRRAVDYFRSSEDDGEEERDRLRPRKMDDAASTSMAMNHTTTVPLITHVQERSLLEVNITRLH